MDSKNDSPRIAALDAAIENLRQAWPGAAWTWDERFGCAVSIFAREHFAAARAAQDGVLPNEWTPANVATAPQPLQQFIERSGSLRPGQIAFSAPPADGVVLFALWWPWTGGDPISSRLGLIGGPAGVDHAARLKRIIAVK